MASYAYTFTSGDTVTPTKLNDARTVSDIVNADIKSDAAIAGTKIAPAFGAQNITVSTANRSITNTGNFALSFGTNNTERVRIDNAGNVGIGTTSPSQKLHVDGVSLITRSSYPVLQLQQTGSTGVGQVAMNGDEFQIRQTQNFAMSMFTNNTERMRIDASGNVGIGTTSPTFKLVAANNATDGAWLYSNSADSYLGLGGYANSGDGAANIRYNRTSGFIDISSGSRDSLTTRMRIKSTGQIRFQPLSADPTGAEAGDVYYNSSTNKLKVYNGTSWLNLH